jgi:hypothetical protein
VLAGCRARQPLGAGAGKPWWQEVDASQRLSLCLLGRRATHQTASRAEIRTGLGIAGVRHRRGAFRTVTMGAGLRPGAKATEMPPGPYRQCSSSLPTTVCTVQWDEAGSGACCGSSRRRPPANRGTLAQPTLRSSLRQFPTRPTFRKSRPCAYQASPADALLAVSFSHSRPSSAGVERILHEDPQPLVIPPCTERRPVLHVSDPRDFDADLSAPRLLSFLLGTKPPAQGGRSNGGFNFPVTNSTSRLLRRGQVPLISRTIALSRPPASTLFANGVCYLGPYCPRWVVL